MENSGKCNEQAGGSILYTNLVSGTDHCLSKSRISTYFEVMLSIYPYSVTVDLVFL